MKKAIEDRELKSLYQHMIAKDPPGDCPTTDQLVALTVDADKDEAVRQHVLHCASCARDIKDLNAIHRHAGGVKGSPIVTWLAAAAVIIGLVGAIWQTREIFREPEVRTLRIGPPEIAVTPKHLSILDEFPSAFDWEDVPGAAGYVFQLSGLDGEVIFESPSLDSSQLDFPKGEIAPDRSHFVWFVQVKGSSEKLGPYVFNLSAEEPDPESDAQGQE